MTGRVSKSRYYGICQSKCVVFSAERDTADKMNRMRNLQLTIGFGKFELIID